MSIATYKRALGRGLADFSDRLCNLGWKQRVQSGLSAGKWSYVIWSYDRALRPFAIVFKFGNHDSYDIRKLGCNDPIAGASLPWARLRSIEVQGEVRLMLPNLLYKLCVLCSAEDVPKRERIKCQGFFLQRFVAEKTDILRYARFHPRKMMYWAACPHLPRDLTRYIGDILWALIWA